MNIDSVVQTVGIGITAYHKGVYFIFIFWFL